MEFNHFPIYMYTTICEIDREYVNSNISKK